MEDFDRKINVINRFEILKIYFSFTLIGEKSEPSVKLKNIY